MKSQQDSLGSWAVSDLGAFFVSNRSAFLSHAKRVTSSNAEAEELVQDSLVRVLLAGPELESEDHARAYFHRVIENLGIDLLRKRGRQPRLVVLDDAAAEVEAQWHEGLDHAETLAAADDAALVREALSLLSPAERAALVMWEFEGRSTSEIARELGVRESSVKHTLSRARSGLRRILSERVIDETRGLTALDALSVSFRKIEKVAQKSSKVALSLLLVLSAFLGMNSIVPNGADSDQYIEPSVQSQEDPNGLVEGTPDVPQENSSFALPLDVVDSSSDDVRQGLLDSTEGFAVRNTDSFFPGLNEEGVPTGFTVSSSSGSLGQLFVGSQGSIATETGFLLSNIVSTRSNAVNVLIDQSLVLDAFGTSYVAQVSVGINGGWQPLVLSYIASDIERLASGDYLLTATMVVDSALETSVKVPTSTSGTDLSSAPASLETRLLLDPTKTKIMAQAVLVSADSQGSGA